MPVALVVEDEPEYSFFVLSAFERSGIEALVMENITNAVDFIEQFSSIDVLFINLTECGYGLELAKIVSKRWPTIKLFILSAQMDRMRPLPPAVFVAKPTTPAVLIAMIEHVALALAKDRVGRGTLH